MNISNASLTAGIQGTATSTVDLSTASAAFDLQFSQSLADGSGDNQANQYWSNNATIAASGTASLDISGGITDAFGATIVFTKIKGCIITNLSGNGAEIEVGGNANAWSTMFGAAADTFKIPDTGSLAFFAPAAAGYAVTAGTGDVLDITNNDGVNVAEYSIILIGAV